MDLQTLGLGLLVFAARIVDVAVGTLRTILIVQGRSALAFTLGFFEVMLWVLVVSTVIQNVRTNPVLVIFFALGFATGNVVGIAVERKLALGITILKVISRTAGPALASRLRADGLRVTTFVGEGMSGPVTELYIVCHRRQIGGLLDLVKQEDPEAFYVIEMARDVSGLLRPTATPLTGWRAVFKRK